MNKTLFYITYQSFPANTANSLQTILNIKYFVKNNINVNLFFPMREKTSSDDFNKFVEKYGVREKFIIKGLKHKLPFGKLKILEKLFFHISHLIWSFYAVRYVRNKFNVPDLFFTRSDWIFYFLSRAKCDVIFECHQYSKLRRFLLSKSMKNLNSKILFLNEYLYKDYKNKNEIKNRYIILQNGVDDELFSESSEKVKNSIIFTGNLKRFNEPRNVEFIIKNIKDDFSLKIIGASKYEKKKLDQVNKEKKNIEIIERLNYQETIQEIKKAEFGLLLNSENNLHSTRYTSPLKYFEYLASGLKILSEDYDSIKALPYSENIHFYKSDDNLSFKNALEKAGRQEYQKKVNIEEISLDSRVKKIISFCKI